MRREMPRTRGGPGCLLDCESRYSRYHQGCIREQGDGIISSGIAVPGLKNMSVFSGVKVTLAGHGKRRVLRSRLSHALARPTTASPWRSSQHDNAALQSEALSSRKKTLP